MKKTLLIASLLGFLYTAKAQTILYSADFNNSDATTGWISIDGDGDGSKWNFTNVGNDTSVERGFSGGFLYSESYDNDNEEALTPDNCIIVPAITIPVGNTAELTYKIGALDADFFSEHYAVYAVSDSDITPETTIGEFLALLTSPLIEETLATVSATGKTINLNQFAGQKIRIVFRHFDVTDQFTIILDDVVITTATSLRINENIEAAFSLYPNPAKNIIYWDIDSGLSVESVSLYDIHGRMLKNEKLDTVTTKSQINISDINPGVYLLTLNYKEGAITRKVIKK